MNIEEKVWLLVNNIRTWKDWQGRLKLRFLTEIGRLHWNQGEEVTHFAWFGEYCQVGILNSYQECKIATSAVGILNSYQEYKIATSAVGILNSYQEYKIATSTVGILNSYQEYKIATSAELNFQQSTIWNINKSFFSDTTRK